MFSHSETSLAVNEVPQSRHRLNAYCFLFIAVRVFISFCVLEQLLPVLLFWALLGNGKRETQTLDRVFMKQIKKNSDGNY
jgi:hypothetical protein